MAPTPTADELERAGITSRGKFMMFTPARDLLRIAELQRAKRGPTGTASNVEAHIVGGSAVLTEISEHAIAQRVVHRWPDRLGKLIDVAPMATPSLRVKNG